MRRHVPDNPTEHPDLNPAGFHTDRRALIAGLGGLAAGALLVGQAQAGPLSPPIGPIAPTPGPEPRIPVGPGTTPGDADSVYKITQPGSYYLTGNITGVSGRHGIEITASGVTLDLMGYSLIGVVESLDGVTATVPGLSRITVRNGHIRNWGQSGIDLASQAVSYCLAEHLSLASNGQEGLSSGDASVVQRCIATDNGGSGLGVLNACTIADCTASYNGVIGISSGVGSAIRHCAAYSNVGAGILVGDASTVVGCASSSNLSWGCSAGAGCTLSQSTASTNANGFQGGLGSVITECVAQSNGDAGFAVGGGGTIQHCIARENGQTGIGLAFRCHALSNTSVCNGGLVANSVGIFTPSSNNRIEGNFCGQNHYGILINGPNNLVIRNTCSGNSENWLFAPNNVFGPIVDRRTPATGQAFGNSVASSLGTTDPNANFSI